MARGESGRARARARERESRGARRRAWRRLGEGRRRREAERVEDEAVLEALHLANLGALLLHRVVAVDDPEPAVQRHVDRHLRLGHRVHRRGDEGQVQLDLPRDIRVEGDVLGVEGDVAGQDDVVAVRVPVTAGEELRGGGDGESVSAARVAGEGGAACVVVGVTEGAVAGEELRPWRLRGSVARVAAGVRGPRAHGSDGE